jgi:hypothetical protein
LLTDFGSNPHWNEEVVESQPSRKVRRMEELKLAMGSVSILNSAVAFPL